MNRYFCVKNCVCPDVVVMNPWDFDVSKVVFDLDEDPQRSKAEYKRRYFKDPKAEHCLFSMVKGVIPGVIVTSGSKGDNPAAEVYGFVGDYDATVGTNVIETLMANPPGQYLPTRWSLTQGNNFRLIWEFEEPIRVDGSEHAAKFLEEVGKRISAVKWGAVFDKEACCNCAQHFDVGRKWGEFSPNRIPKDLLMLWDFEVYRKLYARTKTTYEIPMEAVIEEAKKQFPGRIDFTFSEGARCYRFWDQQSDNRDGCVITRDGVRVFVPHDKPFMSWADILGMKFVDRYSASKVSPVVQAVWYNNCGGEFVRWKDNEKRYVTRDATTMRRDLTAEAGLHQDKKKGDLLSEVDVALHDITTRREVDYAAPIIFFPHGPRTIDGGTKILNTSVVRVLAPTPDIYIPNEDDWVWSNPLAYAKFPFIHGLISTLFELDPARAAARLANGFESDPMREEENIQLQVFLSWLSSFYVSSGNLTPTQGQCLVVAGPSGIGKSFLFTHVVGPLMGGFADADSYYVNGDKFTGTLINTPIHLIDDKICDLDMKSRTGFTTRLKVVVATARLRYEEKYRNAVPSVPWLGRVVIACNMDARSLSILPDLEQSNADKITMLRFGQTKFAFRSQPENREIVKAELPYFARFLFQYKRDPRLFDRRMGVKAFQHPDMRVAAAENGYTNVVIDALRQTVDSLCSEDVKAGKVKSGAEFVGLKGSARYLYDRIADVSQSAARDIGGARQLASQLAQMEQRGYKIVRTKARGSWFYEIPYDFDEVKQSNSVRDAEELDGVIR